MSSAYLLLQSQTKNNCGVPGEQYLPAVIEPGKERIAAPDVWYLPVVIEPGQEDGGVPVDVWCLPVTIRPDHIRLILVHELIQLWHCLFLIVSV